MKFNDRLRSRWPRDRRVQEILLRLDLGRSNTRCRAACEEGKVINRTFKDPVAGQP